MSTNDNKHYCEFCKDWFTPQSMYKTNGIHIGQFAHKEKSAVLSSTLAYMDMDMLRIHPVSSAILLCEWKRGHIVVDNSGVKKVVITEGNDAAREWQFNILKQLLPIASFGLVVYEKPGSSFPPERPKIVGLRKFIGEQASDEPLECDTETFNHELHKWEEKYGSPEYAAKALAAQALALTTRALKARQDIDSAKSGAYQNCDQPLDELAKLLLQRGYGDMFP